jgi:hypothetical protein
MRQPGLSDHDAVGRAVRVDRFGDPRASVSAAEIGMLVLCGAAAALSVGFIKLGLRIPGHAIVIAAVPMAIGFVLAPRRFAGSIMGAGAFGTAAALRAAGVGGLGTGSFASLSLLGPFLDAAVILGRGGWRLYLGLVCSGIATNLVALLSRSGGKLLGLDGPGTRPIATWWSQASVTYVVSGAVAGCLAAAAWYYKNRAPRDAVAPDLRA